MSYYEEKPQYPAAGQPVQVTFPMNSPRLPPMPSPGPQLGTPQVYTPQVHTQPMPMPGMILVPAGGNRNAKNLPMKDGGREWSHGLCNCGGECGTWFMACCFPCVTYGQNKERLMYLRNHGQPHPEDGGCFNEHCLFHAGLTMCGGWGWILQITNRTDTRARYSIRGSGCGDCCASWCCAPCALTQESQELSLEEASLRPQY